ncbi:MAG: BON domain-containing protein [Burkholderiaceae bacterium]
MKTDADLRRDVEDELAWDPQIESSAVGVAVRDGVVTLSGHLNTFAEKFAIERALRRVTGVRAVALELDIRLAPDHRRSDTDIAAAARESLKWSALVPGEHVRVTVDKGRVRLGGEVEWDYQRRGAEQAVRALVGVVGVGNAITIRPKIAPADLQRRISEAFARQVDRELKHLQIEVDGSTVTLRGTVNSWREREAAQGVAWHAPGVRAVINELEVA